MPTPLTLLGLAGGVRVGKDTLAATYFSRAGFRSAAFADPLKARVVGLGLATYEEAYITKPESFRKAIQIEGTENGWMKYGQLLWCRTLHAQLQNNADRWGKDHSRYVISDVRFPHEVDFIHALGGMVYRIEAPTRYAENGISEEARAHLSERALDRYHDHFDGVIYNDPEHADTVGRQIYSLLKAHNLLPKMGLTTGVNPMDLFTRGA